MTTSIIAAVPLLGSDAPNVQASRWLPRMTYLDHRMLKILSSVTYLAEKDVPSAERSRSVRGLGKGVSGKQRGDRDSNPGPSGHRR